jgi:hypothetical protein
VEAINHISGFHSRLRHFLESIFRQSTALSVLAVLRQANLEAGALGIRVHTDIAPMLLNNAANCVEA